MIDRTRYYNRIYRTDYNKHRSKNDWTENTFKISHSLYATMSPGCRNIFRVAKSGYYEIENGELFYILENIDYEK